MKKGKQSKTHDDNEVKTSSKRKKLSLPSFLPGFKKPTLENTIHSEKFWSVTFAVIFLSIALFTAVSLRLAPVNLDVADEWAQSSIQQQGINFFTQQVRSQYPLLADSQVQTRAAELWNEYASNNAAEIEAQRTQLSAAFKNNYQYETQDAQGRTYRQTYIFEMDPYYFLQQAINYASHGSVCEAGSESLGKWACHEEKRLAPVGTTERLNFHTLLESWFIKIGKARGITDPITAVFLLPIFLISLSTIPAFFIGRRLAGNLGGFIAAMVLVTHPVIMNRTVAGWVDTDPYAIMFPLFIIWFAIEAFAARKWWSRSVMASLSGITAGLYSFAWGGWWFMLFVTTICFLAYAAYHLVLIARKGEWKNKSAYKEITLPLIATAAFLIFSGVVATIFSSFQNFVSAFTQPFAQTANLQAATAVGTIGWPNILTTVAELNIPALSAIVQNFGGGVTLVVVLAFFGIFATLFNPKKLSWLSALAVIAGFIYYLVLFNNGLGLSRMVFLALLLVPIAIAVLYHLIMNKELDLHSSIFIMGWLVATFFAATQGVRFVMLGVPAFAIGFGIAIGWMVIALSSAISRVWKKPFLVHGLISIIALALIFSPVAAYNPIKIGEASAKNQAPNINDAWWNANTYLRENTPENTIVTSWWDFGHWFRNIGNRAVTFDGGSQNPQPGHLVGKTLLTNDEREAVGILRMLNCGQHTAYETAHQTLDVVPAKELIDELVLLDKNAARARLAQTSIPSGDQELILNNTHCEPRPQVFITSGDMIGKAGVWGHFGSWDFRRSMAYVYANTRTMTQQEAVSKIESFGMTQAEATALYLEARSLSSESQANTWVSGWPTYLTQNFVTCSVTTNNLSQEIVSCPFMTGVAQTDQGVVAIENINFRPSAPDEAAMSLGVYANNQRLGGQVTRVARVVVADRRTGEMREYEPRVSEVSIGMLIRITPGANGAPTTYQALLADPVQIDSMFTKLYFLDGEFTPNFTILDRQVESGGGIITIWNVTWPQD